MTLLPAPPSEPWPPTRSLLSCLKFKLCCMALRQLLPSWLLRQTRCDAGAVAVGITNASDIIG